MARDLNQALRPRDWDKVVGQSDIKDIILKSIYAGNFPKFSIFCGPTGVGKSCMAELAAQTLLCTGDPSRPCGKCAGCTIQSKRSIIKHNMAAMMGKKDIVQVLDGIFKYEGIDETTIYILEEVQVLKQKEEQTPFLEELTKIPDGVYVMMCTTQVSKLLPALRNRATIFQLTVPTAAECTEYIRYILETINCRPMSEGAMYSLAALSEYTPRNIVKNIELLAIDGSISEETMNKFFKTVSKSIYIDLLNYIMSPDCSTKVYVQVLTELQSQLSYTKLLAGLKDFALTALIEMCVGSADPTISRRDRNKLQSIMSNVTESDFTRLVDKIGDIGYDAFNRERDAMYELIKLKMFMQKKTTATVFANNTREAGAERAQNIAKSRVVSQHPLPETGVQTLSPDSDLSTLLGFDTGIAVEPEDDDD